MTKNEVIERLCKLMAEVNEHFGCVGEADCICPDRTGVGEYRNNGVAVNFIEDATRACLQLHQAGLLNPMDTIVQMAALQSAVESADGGKVPT